MNLCDFRRNSRRTSMVRRRADRRATPYSFGSPEWIESVKKNYVAWPKWNRRGISRRSDERRAFDRRYHQLSEQKRSEQKYSKILLTEEEKQFIEDIFMSDFD